MSRTRKHKDLFFLRFLHRIIKQIGSPFTHPRASRWHKVRKRVSRLYGGTNWGDNQRVDCKYNYTPKRRAQKRSERFCAIKEAKLQLEDYD